MSVSSCVRAMAAAVMIAAALLPPAAFAATVFVATLRAPTGSADAGGQLYRVDPESGKSTFIGRILVDGTQPLGLTGLAWDRKGNGLYGITLGVNDAQRATLYVVDPRTAEARLVARLSQPLTDISFDPEGRLFGWTANTGQLAIVDIRSGKVSAIGPERERQSGGAFAIDSRGNGFVATWTPPATVDRVDLRGGNVVLGPPVSKLEDSSTLRSMAFSDDGQLLATHSVRNAKTTSMLLRIDPDSGEASPVSAIPEDSEAIAFAGSEPGARAETMRWLGFGIVMLALLALAWAHFGGARRPRTRA